MPSQSFRIFNNYIVKEVRFLVETFADKNSGRGRNSAYGLLNGALVLLVAGWEAYCEDVSKESVKKLSESKKLKFDTLPDSIKNKILIYAYVKNIDHINPLKTTLGKLPDEGWKSLFEKMVTDFLSDLNTPKFQREQDKGKTLKKLFALYLQTKDIEKEISSLTKIDTHTSKLDDMIRIRGEIAHRGRPKPEDRLSKEKLEDYLSMLQKACAAIDYIILHEFRQEYDIKPWRMSKTIRGLLPGFSDSNSATH